MNFHSTYLLVIDYKQSHLMKPSARASGSSNKYANIIWTYFPLGRIRISGKIFTGPFKVLVSGLLWTALSTISGYGQTQQNASSLQSAAPLQETSAKLLQSFQQEQASLMQERRALVAAGATQQQLQAWRQQNASRLQAQQQRVQALGAASVVHPRPGGVYPEIPANASQTLRDYLTTQAALANERTQTNNQILQSMSVASTEADIQQIRMNQSRTLLKQHATDLQLQRQKAQALAMESTSIPLPVPSAAVIPTNATPQMKAYLTVLNELSQGHAQVWNQYLGAAPATKQAAMVQWRKQNVDQIAQLRQLAQQLAKSGTTN